MVLYFSPRGHEPGKDDWSIYMGKDKVENEDLIRWGLPHDVWFHVSDMSSAHVYLRLPVGCSLDDIPADLLEDCCQLVKANSIQGSKDNNIDVVYTPWSNLKKTASMDVGQVGFHSGKLVRKVRVERKINEIINRLNKTKREANPSLQAEREAFDRQERSAKKAETQRRWEEEKQAKETTRRQEELRSYKHVMQDDAMQSRSAMAEKYKSPEEYEDDFL